MNDIRPVRVNIHPDLEEELKFWKDILEVKAGHKLEGGRPTVSKLCAEILKTLRIKETRDRKHIIIELKKIHHTNKCEVIFL